MAGEPPGPMGKGGHKPVNDPGTLICGASPLNVPLCGSKSVARHLGSYLVGMSKKLPGYDANGYPAEDIQNADAPPQSARLKDDKELFYTLEADLKDKMEDLFEHVSWGQMTAVAREMVKRFFQGRASKYPCAALKTWSRMAAENWFSQVQGTYKSSKLDAEVQQNLRMAAYHMSFLRELHTHLRTCNFDLAKLALLEMDSDGLAFTALDDQVLGLGITVNQVWAVKAELESYATNGTDWNGVLKYKLYDHFGLDWHDVVKTENWMLPLGRQRTGDAFKAWYLLQHYRGAKAFLTEITVRYPVGNWRLESKPEKPNWAAMPRNMPGYR